VCYGKCEPSRNGWTSFSLVAVLKLIGRPQERGDNGGILKIFSSTAAQKTENEKNK
jgi:hypothetical protein